MMLGREAPVQGKQRGSERLGQRGATPGGGASPEAGHPPRRVPLVRASVPPPGASAQKLRLRRRPRVRSLQPAGLGQGPGWARAGVGMGRGRGQGQTWGQGGDWAGAGLGRSQREDQQAPQCPVLAGTAATSTLPRPRCESPRTQDSVRQAESHSLQRRFPFLFDARGRERARAPAP